MPDSYVATMWIQMPCNYCSEEARDNAYKILAENSYSALVDNKIKTTK